MPAKARVQRLHLLHCPGRGELQPGCGQAQFQEAQIGKGNNAAQDVAANFAVRPVSHRLHLDEIVIFGLAKALLHNISVQAGTDDFIRTPIHPIRNQHILPEPVDMPLDSIMVLTKTHGQTSIFHGEIQVVKEVWKMQFLANIPVALPDLLFVTPLGSLGMYF